MTDMHEGWMLVCHRCGDALVNHTIYLDDPPTDAIEGEFDIPDGPMRGFYCLRNPDD